MAKAKEKPLQSMAAGTTKTPRAEKPTRNSSRGRREIPQGVEEVGPAVGAVRRDLAVEGEEGLQVPAPLRADEPGTQHPQPSAQNKGCAQEQEGTGMGLVFPVPTGEKSFCALHVYHLNGGYAGHVPFRSGIFP